MNATILPISLASLQRKPAREKESFSQQSNEITIEGKPVHPSFNMLVQTKAELNVVFRDCDIWGPVDGPEDIVTNEFVKNVKFEITD